MGRIRTRWIKNIAEEIALKFPDKVSVDYEQNKALIDSMNLGEDKFVRNKVAGYMVKIAQRKAA